MDELLRFFLQSIYILMPAYFANMAPPIFKKFKLLESLNKPIDKKERFFDKNPVFGNNKTYRGFIAGLIFAVIAVYIQMFLSRFQFFQDISLPGIDYSSHFSVLLLAVLLGLGALTGDLVKSFFKRRVNIKSGQKFIPWDQTDHIIGAYIFMLPIAYSQISWKLFGCSVAVGFFLHIIVNHIAYYIGIRKEKW